MACVREHTSDIATPRSRCGSTRTTFRTRCAGEVDRLDTVQLDATPAQPPEGSEDQRQRRKSLV
jgi:hypothetical protein